MLQPAYVMLLTLCLAPNERISDEDGARRSRRQQTRSATFMPPAEEGRHAAGRASEPSDDSSAEEVSAARRDRTVDRRSRSWSAGCGPARFSQSRLSGRGRAPRGRARGRRADPRRAGPRRRRSSRPRSIGCSTPPRQGRGRSARDRRPLRDRGSSCSPAFRSAPGRPDPHRGQCTAGRRSPARLRRLARCATATTGSDLSGPGLIVHLIRAHGFFEGFHSPSRVDPRALARVLEL